MSNVLEFPARHTNHSDDRTLAVLLEQAFRIKEEVSSGLQRSAESAQSRAVSRALLQNHILTITRIVQQLSASVQTLQRQIAERDWVTCSTSQAVQRLDHKNGAGIGDLRGRVARCDASLTRLSAEVQSTDRQVTRLQHDVAQSRAAVDVAMQEVRLKLQRDLGRLEACLAEVYEDRRGFMSDVQNQVGKVQNQLYAKIVDAVRHSNTLKKWTEQQIQDCAQKIEQSHQQLHENMDALLDRHHGLETGLERLRSHQERCASDQAERQQHVETRLGNRVESLEKDLRHQLQLLKHDCNRGFRSVRDAIETLNDIVDLKSHWKKEKFKRNSTTFAAE